jgi:hypothetical protein
MSLFAKLTPKLSETDWSKTPLGQRLPRTKARTALCRTLTHLMGNYLNLYDLWNESQPCADDYVDDTPIHNAPNGRFWQYRHVSTCDGSPVEMT